MPTIQVRLAESAADRELCLRLRWTVFVEEQGVPPSLEVDEHDSASGAAAAVHALAIYDGVPAGAGRFIFVAPGEAKIQRMAVIDDVRGRGLGLALLRFLEGEARQRGATRFLLWAQTSARGFYEKAGYAAQGAEFLDAGIAHVRMTRGEQP